MREFSWLMGRSRCPVKCAHLLDRRGDDDLGWFWGITGMSSNPRTQVIPLT